MRKTGNIPQLEMLASLQRQLRLGLAHCAFQSQHDLLGCLGLLVEYRLRLTTVTGLLAVVSTLSLGEQRGLGSSVSPLLSSLRSSGTVTYFSGLVLGDLVLSVLFAGLALAVGAAGLGNVDLAGETYQLFCCGRVFDIANQIANSGRLFASLSATAPSF